MQLWDYLITGIIVLVLVMFITGNGDMVFDLFGGAQTREMMKNYDRRKVNRATIVFCLVMLVNEIIIIAGPDIPQTGYISVAVGFASLLGYGLYLRNCCKKS